MFEYNLFLSIVFTFAISPLTSLSMHRGTRDTLFDNGEWPYELVDTWWDLLFWVLKFRVGVTDRPTLVFGVVNMENSNPSFEDGVSKSIKFCCNSLLFNYETLLGRVAFTSLNLFLSSISLLFKVNIFFDFWSNKLNLNWLLFNFLLTKWDHFFPIIELIIVKIRNGCPILSFSACWASRLFDRSILTLQSSSFF